jgi:hypothetical protein
MTPPGSTLRTVKVLIMKNNFPIKVTFHKMIENHVKVGQKQPHVAETTLQAKHYFTEKLA